jgi:hypothetical protein
MKNKSLRIRISERRLSRLQNYAVQTDKTMTQVIEELLDTLPNTKNGDSDAGVPANASPDGDATRTLSSTHCPVNPAD